MTKKEKELLADRAAARYYVGNLLVYAKALNTELCQLGFHSESANDYGMQINDNLNRLAEKLNVKIMEEQSQPLGLSNQTMQKKYGSNKDRAYVFLQV